MILLDTFKKDEILKSTRSFEKGDPSIVELVVHAFYLLEQLSVNKLDFVFKGGTALMLYFDPPTRFSTDIDIITLETRDKIENILNEICKQDVFLGWELQEKRSYQLGIPKAHYSLYFNSSLQELKREILLDILFEENLYPKTDSLQNDLKFLIHNDEIVKIDVPPADALLGDKLTAFAPGTTGIKFNNKKGRDIIKQVFDIGRLFDRLEDIELVKDTFINISEKEIKYRALNIGVTEIARDVLNTCFLFGRIQRNIKIDSEIYIVNEVRGALMAFRPFTTSRRVYTIDDLLHDASVASYLIALIATDSISNFSKFDGDIKKLIKYYFKEPELNYLNRFAKFPNGTLYYLKSAHELIK